MMITSVTPVQGSIQVTNHVMKELNQLGFARPLTTEAVLTVSKNIFKGKIINVADYYMLKGLTLEPEILYLAYLALEKTSPAIVGLNAFLARPKKIGWAALDFFFDTIV